MQISQGADSGRSREGRTARSSKRGREKKQGGVAQPDPTTNKPHSRGVVRERDWIGRELNSLNGNADADVEDGLDSARTAPLFRVSTVTPVQQSAAGPSLMSVSGLVRSGNRESRWG